MNPLAALQIIDYRDPTVDATIQLVTAVHSLVAKPQPLPDPLPQEPPVPFGYITRLGNQLAEKELSPQQQLQLLVELRSGLDEDGDDPSARSDIAQLLRMMRLRHDVTYRTRNDIDNVLASIEATPDVNAQPGSPGPGPQRLNGPGESNSSAEQQISRAHAGDAGTDQGSRKRLIIIGGATVAVIVAIVVAIVLATQGSDHKRPATPSAARPGPTQPARGQGPQVPHRPNPLPWTRSCSARRRSAPSWACRWISATRPSRWPQNGSCQTRTVLARSIPHKMRRMRAAATPGCAASCYYVMSISL